MNNTRPLRKFTTPIFHGKAAHRSKKIPMAKPSQLQQPGVKRGTSDTPGYMIKDTFDPEGIAANVFTNGAIA